MFKVRTTKTGSGHTAVQVVSRRHQKTDIVKHIGTAHDREELNHLIQLANQYLSAGPPNVQPLFPELFMEKQANHHVVVENLSFTKTYHMFAYEFLSFFYTLNGFTALENNLLRDLSFMRIIEPASKLRSAELCNIYFGTSYTQFTLYDRLPSIRLLKEQAEKAAVAYAKKHLYFNFRLIFYDVTTLYFETFKEDEDKKDKDGNIVVGLRKTGYGKEFKPGQPIVIIGLLVNNDGYPISVEMFSGKTFEGHTMIPVIKALQKRYGITTLTVVADAAMLKNEHMKDLREAGLSYIVGARMGSVKKPLLKRIAKKLHKTVGKYVRVQTDMGKLVCDYSEKRARKDRFERKKQLLKAQYQIDHPEKVKRKTRFVTEETKASFTLNKELIKEVRLREGIKGYYTNLKNVSSKLIVAKYHELWHVEKSFRIAKSDLQARPVFAHTRESIETHILIVFVSLCLAKSIELKSGYSIKKVKDMIWEVLDIEFSDTLTGNKFLKRMDTISNPMKGLIRNLSAQTEARLPK